MATSAPSVNGHQNGADYTPSDDLEKLSLSSKTIHADDFLNKGQDVAPPMHVSTTFRYNKNPDALKAWNELDVSFWFSPPHPNYLASLI